MPKGFKPGDRVVIADTEHAAFISKAVSYFVPAVGTAGVIETVDSLGAWVRWEGNHGCARDSTWVPFDVLQRATDALRTKDGCGQKIVIYRIGQSVIAKDYSFGKTAEAKCSPHDEFNFHTGAALAFERLLDLEKPAPEPEESAWLNTKVVCVEKGKGMSGSANIHWWTVGKIYPVIGGVIQDDDGNKRAPVKSVAQLNEALVNYVKFIELV